MEMLYYSPKSLQTSVTLSYHAARFLLTQTNSDGNSEVDALIRVYLLAVCSFIRWCVEGKQAAECT